LRIGADPRADADLRAVTLPGLAVAGAALCALNQVAALFAALGLPASLADNVAGLGVVAGELAPTGGCLLKTSLLTGIIQFGSSVLRSGYRYCRSGRVRFVRAPTPSTSCEVAPPVLEADDCLNSFAGWYFPSQVSE
jgi:hypothetical protein